MPFLNPEGVPAPDGGAVGLAIFEVDQPLEDATMLGTAMVHPVLLSKDLDASRSFYHDLLGLEILSESDHKIEFGCGGGTKLAVSKSTTGTADTQTQIAWEVEDLQTEVNELASRGVAVQDYDIPGLKTEEGIADVGFAWMAWIIDPGKNALAIVQLKR